MDNPASLALCIDASQSKIHLLHMILSPHAKKCQELINHCIDIHSPHNDVQNSIDGIWLIEILVTNVKFRPCVDFTLRNQGSLLVVMFLFLLIHLNTA